MSKTESAAMELILWRHAEAEDNNPAGDLARRLTARGEKQSRATASWLRSALPAKTRILVSPAVRTQMTAHALGLNFEIEPGLLPQEDTEALLAAVGRPEMGGAVLVVGHQPTLGRVAARLLLGVDGDLVVKKGSIWWLALRRRDHATHAVLRTVLTARQLRAGKLNR